MISELHNKKDCYPFDVQFATLSQAQKLVVQGIASLQLCLRNINNEPQKAHLKKIQNNSLIFQIGDCLVAADSSGHIRLHGPESTQLQLIQNNSYIEFDNDLFPQGSLQGSYNLPLLQEVLFWVPAGLEITCIGHELKAHAESEPQPEGVKKTYTNTIKFVNGFNNQVHIQSPSVIFAAGAALGQGVVPVSVIEQKLGPTYIPEQIVYKGLRNINGLYPQVWFDASAHLNKKISVDEAKIKISLSTRADSETVTGQ